jgi:hypothetical protein
MWWPFSGDDPNTLYAILPYFNFNGSTIRKQLYDEFYEKYKNTPGLKLIKAVLKPRDDIMWYKEHLINRAIQKLPKNWKYVAWIDADLTFLNRNWVEDTKAELDKCDVVQIWQKCVNLGEKGDIAKLDSSFAYMNTLGQPWMKTHKYGFWHPGYAWACTRDAYTRMGGLVDFAILGSADHHMALALIGKVDNSRPNNISDAYKQKLLDYQERVTGMKLGYVEGTIVHHYHGDLQNRRYVERWDILTKHNYDPDHDIVINKKLSFTERGKRFNILIYDYFLNRGEA